MTSRQAQTIKHIEATHEAERFIASQAARDVDVLDAVSVLYVVQAKIEAGLIDEAKAIVKAYREGNL